MGFGDRGFMCWGGFCFDISECSRVTFIQRAAASSYSASSQRDSNKIKKNGNNESIEYPCGLKMNRAIKTGMGDTFGPIAKIDWKDFLDQCPIHGKECPNRV